MAPSPIGFKQFVIERLRAIEANQQTIIGMLQTAADQESKMKVDLSDVLKAVEEQKTVDASIETLVDGFATKLDTLAQQPTVDPADLSNLAASIRANNAGIQAKVTANTPVSNPSSPNPPPPPPPGA